MTTLPVGDAGDQQWGFHQRVVGQFVHQVLDTEATLFTLSLPMVEWDRLWLIERLVATANAESVELRVAVTPERLDRRRATLEPALIVDAITSPGRIAVLSRPAPIVVPAEHYLVVEWRGVGAAPGPSGYELGLRADVSVLRRL